MLSYKKEIFSPTGVTLNDNLAPSPTLPSGEGGTVSLVGEEKKYYNYLKMLSSSDLYTFNCVEVFRPPSPLEKAYSAKR
jgi:hypothetical protein